MKKIRGVGRVGDNEKALIAYFDEVPSDDDLRELHQCGEKLFRYRQLLLSAMHALRSYECGNVSAELAKSVADELTDAIGM